jgi:hypothetical protein
MIKCSECGYENMDGLDYCDGCGAKLESVAAPGAASTPASPAAALSSSTSGGAESSEANEAAAAAAPVVAGQSATSAAAPAPSGVSAEPPASNEHTAAVPEPSPAKAPTGEMNAGAAAASAAETTVSFKAKLSIIRGGRRGQEFELESGNNLVGRWDPETGAFPEVDLDADDPEAKVSRKHALIRIDAAKITIEDIGSLNGTYVNRQPRLQPGNPLDLKDGDEIIIGKTFLKLSIDPIS